jgi:hypothetical protein
LGTFPATLSLTVDSVSGGIVGYFLSFQIQNSSNGLTPQTILTSFFTNNPTTFMAQDPQLLGDSTAFTGVTGTVVSGSFTNPDGTFELGSGFGTDSPVPLVLSAPTSGGNCVLSLTGVLYARPN